MFLFTFYFFFPALVFHFFTLSQLLLLFLLLFLLLLLSGNLSCCTSPSRFNPIFSYNTFTKKKKLHERNVLDVPDLRSIGN